MCSVLTCGKHVSAQITASLSLMRRLPPNTTEQNLPGLLNLIPAETDVLWQRADQPLTEETDSESVTNLRRLMVRLL
jgi:hypothetical protein